LNNWWLPMPILTTKKITHILDSHVLKAKGDDSHEIILTNEMGLRQVWGPRCNGE
jgi:hypothetical protein